MLVEIPASHFGVAGFESWFWLLTPASCFYGLSEAAMEMEAAGFCHPCGGTQIAFPGPDPQLWSGSVLAFVRSVPVIGKSLSCLGMKEI